MESPEWIPALSTCSIIPGISTVVPSEMQSTSSSVPGIYLSIKTELPILPERIIFINLRTSPAERTTLMPCPPIT